MGENFWAILRQRAGLTQEAFAQKMDVSVDTVRGWEGGRYNPSTASATKAADVGGISPLKVVVGHEVHSAHKSISRGDTDRSALLGRAEELALLASKADEEEDSDVLVAAAEELRGMASELGRISDEIEQPDSAKKSRDEDLEEGRGGRDVFGKKTEKMFSRRLGSDAIESEKSSSRPDKGRDITGKSSKKLFGKGR